MAKAKKILKTVTGKAVAPKKALPAKSSNKPRQVRTKKPTPKPKDSFYIVGIGASAGGLEAFEQFFRNMPADSGLAFVLIPHLDPTHKSIMTDLLQRYTGMKIFQAEDGMKVRQNCVYIIPQIGHRKMLLNARQIKHRGLITQTILLAVEYITLPEKNERRSKMDGGPLS